MAIKSNIIVVFCFFIIITLYIPLFINGEDSYIGSSMDYLDSNVVWMKILAESNLAFAPNITPLPNIENQYRVNYGNELDFIFILFKIFPPYYALIINSFLITATGYFSMYKFGKFITPKTNSTFLSFVALSFSLLHFWQFGGISLAASPYVILIFLKIIRKIKLNYFEIFFPVFYVFYSNFIVSGMFFIFLLLTATLYFFLKEKRFSFRPLFFIFVLFAGYLITNYRFLLETINPTFISNRTIGIPAEVDWKTGIKVIIERFWNEGNTHAPFMHHLIIYLFIIYIIIGLFQKLPNYKKSITVFFLIIFCTTISYFNFNIFPQIIKYMHLDFIFGLSLYRFYFFNGVFWYIILFFIISDLYLNKIKVLKWALPIYLILNFYLILRVNVPYQNIRHSYREYYFSFKDYYMLEEFTEINKMMPKDKGNYRVVSYGFDPAAAQYAGYHTADGYFPYYEKSYKQKFRQLINPILNQNENLKIKYDSYMSQNFIFVDDFTIGQQVLQKYSKKEKELEIDPYMILELNISYIFSTIPLNNNYLELHQNIKSKYWLNIYIYKINKKKIENS